MFTINDIYVAYRRLKSYCYYDNHLLIKKSFAEFDEKVHQEFKKRYGEADFHCDDEMFKTVFSSVCQPLLDILNFKQSLFGFYNYLENSSYYMLPKKKHHQNTEESIFGDFLSPDKIEDYRCFVDVPLEIHLVSALWVERCGISLLTQCQRSNYSLRLLDQFSKFGISTESDVLDEEIYKNQIDNFAVFSRYSDNYKLWEDSAKDAINQIQNSGKNALAIRLDIESYFQNVDIPDIFHFLATKFPEYRREDRDVLILSHFVDEINHYFCNQYRLDEHNFVKQRQISILPLGLLSSDVLGTLYLHSFDKRIEQIIDEFQGTNQVKYYGRYVDDMLFVIQIDDQSKLKDIKANKDIVNSFLSEFFDSVIDIQDTDRIKLKGDLYENIYLNSEKINFQFFDNELVSDFSKEDAPIFKFSPSSSFQFLQPGDLVQHFQKILSSNNSIGNQTFTTSESLREKNEYGKLFKQSMISLSYQVDEQKDNQELVRKLTLFLKRHAVDYYSFWYRAFSLSFMDRSEKRLDFIKGVAKLVSDSITGVKIKLGSRNLNTKLKHDLQKFLLLSISFPYSYSLDSGVEETLMESFIGTLPLYEINTIRKQAIAFRYSNLYKDTEQSQFLSLTPLLYKNRRDLFATDKLPLLSIKPSRLLSFYLFPRIVHWNEIFSAYIKYYRSTALKLQQQIEVVNDLFVFFNYSWLHLFTEQKLLEGSRIDIVNINNKEQKINAISIKEYSSTEKKKESEEFKLKVGIVNYKIEKENIDYVLKRHTTNKGTFSKRLKLINELLENAVKNHCEIVVFPEMSIPIEIINYIATFSRRHNIGIIAGLEYLRTNKCTINYVATFLPFYHNNTTSCYIRLREKNHYAPEEQKILGKKMYSPWPISYDLFHWRKSYFTVFNCFELAAIEDRQLLKSKIDFMVATELNKDVKYFDNISKSIARDLHCFYIQVNTSEFGDSKIIRPSSSVTQTMAAVSGGKNVALLSDELNISELRTEQLMVSMYGYTVMDDSYQFKPIPPNFDSNGLLMRLTDRDL